jgi:2-oxo-3-hexenedioate decarboxylase/2-keto-4-pentenoate hydratase
MQELLGVSEPDCGYILDSTVLPNGAAAPVTAFWAPRVEPQVAFLMRAPLGGPGVTALRERAKPCCGCGP